MDETINRVAPRAPDNPQAAFQAAMARYYHAERDRTEKCLTDIVDIMGLRQDNDATIRRVLDRLVEHYSRT